MIIECEYCGSRIKELDDYIKFEGERICHNCFSSCTITDYYVGGEYVGSTDDGVEEFTKGIDD